MIAFVRSLLFSTYTILATIVTASLALLLTPFPYNIRYRVINLYARSVIRFLTISCGIEYRIEGQENVPDTPAIIFCKHQSTWETFALQVMFPPQSYVFKNELLWIPFFGWGLLAMKPIAIKRGAGKIAIQQLVKGGLKRLKEGLFVVIFPEGTRTRPTGPGRYRIGGAVLAAETGYPVVPVAHNAGEFWPRKSFIKHPGKVTVRIGPPIESRGKTPDEILAEAKDWIESQMPQITIGPYEAKAKTRS